MTRLYIIDDDPDFCDLLASFLAQEGIETGCAKNAAQALAEIQQWKPDLVILDVCLPDGNGFDLLRAIRSHSDVPVIMLTGRSHEVDRVLGLELGADDYVDKPPRLRELAARIRAVLRRKQFESTPGKTADPDVRLSVGGLDIHPSARLASVAGRHVPLTGAEFDILVHLARQSGRLVEREALIGHALGSPTAVDDTVLNVHICNLRRKLGEEVAIKTIRGRGYLLAENGLRA